MRVTKILGSLLAVGVALVAITSSTESSAGGDEALVKVSCAGGALTASGTGDWHVNDEAPWKWDKGEKVSVSKKDNLAKFKGGACEGTVKAYICSGASCKGPISVAVK